MCKWHPRHRYDLSAEVNTVYGQPSRHFIVISVPNFPSLLTLLRDSSRLRHPCLITPETNGNCRMLWAPALRVLQSS